MGDFPFPSSGLDLEESSRLLTAVICGLWELPRTRFLHRCCFFCWKWWIPGITRVRKLPAKSLWLRQRKSSCWEHLSLWGPAVSPWQRITEEERCPSAPTRSHVESRGATAEMSGDEEGSQSFKGLWIKTVGVVYERSFAKNRTQMARNSSPPLLPS